MPGLVGIVSKNDVKGQLLWQMANSIKHEEFHKIDKYFNPEFGVARVHLGIFNPEPQPIFNEDKSLCIFMEGKIYGYEEEMNELKNKHDIKIGNDPEFCLHMYEEYGIDFVKKLNGSFVIVIYDLEENKTIIVNDRYGLRPIYYAQNDGMMLFSSEVKAILEDTTFKKELNYEAVADFFAFGKLLGNKTFIRGIEVLPPASIFVYDKINSSLEQYWDFTYEPDYNLSEDEIADKLVEIFRKAVNIRMKDNLRYGVSLSGGLDSRSILGAIDKNNGKHHTTFTFGSVFCDEVKIAKMVAEELKIEHKVIDFTPEEILPYSREVINYSDGMDTIGICLEPFVFNKVRAFVDVSIQGVPGDLSLGGSYLNKNILKATNDDELLEILCSTKNLFIFSDDLLSKLFNNEYYKIIKDMPLISVKELLGRMKGKNYGNRCDYFYLQNHVRRFALMGSVIDRNKIEEAQPFYDNEFIDLIMKIPPELRLNHRIYRRFLIKLAPELAKIPYNKTMVRADAPFVIWKIGSLYQGVKGKFNKTIFKLSGGKISFSNERSYVNFDKWFRTNEDWKRFTEVTLLNSDALIKKYVNQQYIKLLIKDQKAGINHSTRLINLLTFELFLQMFFQGKEGM